MKNKVFSSTLYLEMLRQTKTIGIVSAILSLISSVLPATINVIYYMSLSEKEQSYYSITKIDEASFFMGSFVICSVMVLLLVSKLFSHLNSRKASDFYHSMPVSRSCYFITALSTVFTWCIFSTVISALIALIPYSIAPIYILDASVFWNSLSVSFALMLLVSGCTALALSLSGTKVSNVTLLLLIMFGPRLIITMITSLVSDITLIGGIDIFLFSENYYNIIFGSIQHFFMESYNYNAVFANPSSMIYTAVLGLIYLVISFFVMKYRKSELAENAAPNKYMRHVYSVLVAFIVSVVFTNVLLNEIYHISNNGSTNVTLIICALLTIIVFFIFEGIFSKSIKKTFRSAPAFLAVIVLNVVLTLSIMGISNPILSYAPSADEIESISINTNNNSSYSNYNYITAKTSGILVSDDELIELFAEEYKECIDIIQEDPYLHTNYNGKPNIYDYVTDNNTFVTVEFKDGSTMKRNFLTNSINKLYIQKAVAEYGKEYIGLPEDYEIEELDVETYSLGLLYDVLSENDTKELWQTFKKEYEGLSDENKLKISGVDEYIAGTDNTGTIYTGFYLYGSVNGIEYNQNYYISDKTPETARKLFELIQKYDNVSKFNDALSGNLNTYEVYFYVMYNPDSTFGLNEYTGYYSYNMIEDGKLSSNVDITYIDENASTSVENIKKAIKLAVDNSGKAIDFNRPILLMSIDLNDPYDYNWSENNYYTLVFQLSDEDTEIIKELLPVVETYYYNS